METENFINNSNRQFYKGSEMHSFTGTKGYVPTTAKAIKMRGNCVKSIFTRS